MIVALCLCMLLAALESRVQANESNSNGVADAASVFLSHQGRNSNSLDQGGETCATATNIPSLPYCDRGTTIGYADDYTPPCSTPNAAPDVVYAYRPTTVQIISASTCGSNFNTVLHIWRGCPTNDGTLICCNDDYPACAPASCCNDITLQPNQVYYFIIDGAGNAAGDYVFQITLSQSCPPPCTQIDTCHYASLDVEPANNTCLTSPVTLTCPDTICGSIIPAGDADWYTVVIPGPSCAVMAIDVFGNDTPGWYPFGRGLDPRVFLVALNCTTIVARDDSGGVGNDCHLVSQCLQPGVYHIRVDGQTPTTTGPYILALACRSCQCDACPYASRDLEPLNDSCGTFNPIVQCGDTLCGEITPVGDRDWYLFQMNAVPCGMVTIDVLGNDTPGWYPFGHGLNPRVWIISNDCSTILASDDNSGVGNDSRLVSACIPPGFYHIMVEGVGAAAPSTGPYILAIGCVSCQCPETCVVVCPDGAIPEGEPCPNIPDNFNGGCDASTPSFSPISCGETVCGTAWASEVVPSDEDWYRFRLTESDSVRWCVRAEFPVLTALFGFGPGVNPCLRLDTIDCGRADPCNTVCIGACLEPGTYAVVVTPVVAGPMTCRTYVAHLDCAPCLPTLCEAPDSLVISFFDPTSSDIHLFWPPVPGADDYRIYRSSDPSVPISPLDFLAQINAVGVTEPEFVDSGVVSGSDKYFYTVVCHCRPHRCNP